MSRIFLTLATVGTLLVLVNIWLGFDIADPREPDPHVQRNVAVHLQVGVAAIVFCVLVHALMLTYFMGTGRWLEETSLAYRLGDDAQRVSRELKWRLYPALTLALLALITTGAFGAMADPASGFFRPLWGPIAASTVHQIVVWTTLSINLVVNVIEYNALEQNGRLVDGILQRVHAIRKARGLPTDDGERGQ